MAQLQLRGVEISTGTYSKVEMGLNNPSVDLLIALTDILGCDFNSFLWNIKNESKKDCEEMWIINIY